MSQKITAIFTDIGGVLLTNGWDRKARAEAVEKFKLNAAELEDRHHLTFDTYESGKLLLDEYLDRIVFYEPRSFSKETFKQFMYNYSQPYEDMIQLLKKLKAQYQLKTVVVSNEGRELNRYRIETFQLTGFIDFFVSSSFVHLRKPDVDIFKVALDMAQVPLEQILYIDDRPLFVQVAQGLGIKGIIHRNYGQTKQELAAYGLVV
ncbi:hydrolase [Niabella ginsenosidivorans]|uniref:Hydrolase n=1 Tax=Niabella ginsenosidivorans TaxID=1176587 RepID=A0A1A9I2A8_9BACT|nr:HAD family phosphatase [Niabella ginsenosidivorans]ANH81797.1 hydrolase [Niabella ginsenosidivorans]